VSDLPVTVFTFTPKKWEQTDAKHSSQIENQQHSQKLQKLLRCIPSHVQNKNSSKLATTQSGPSGTGARHISFCDAWKA
jgi:hypothetical protein